jgi:hypothetical protein
MNYISSIVDNIPTFRLTVSRLVTLYTVTTITAILTGFYVLYRKLENRITEMELRSYEITDECVEVENCSNCSQDSTDSTDSTDIAEILNSEIHRSHSHSHSHSQIQIANNQSVNDAESH